MTLLECVRIAFKGRRSPEAAEGRLRRRETRMRPKADRRRHAALAAWTLAAACGPAAVSPAAGQGVDEANAIAASPMRETSSTHLLRDREAFVRERDTGEQGVGRDPAVSVATSSRTPLRADPSESSGSRAVILVYHHVDTTTPASTSVTPERFAGHLDLLAAGGYRVVPLADVVEALRFGKALPDRAVVLTFDDAWRSVYTEAFPLLQRRGWPFTVFVSTDAVDGRHGNTMSWNQLREIEAGGGTIGNHSRTHDHLVRRRDGETREQWRRRVGDDILWARRRFVAELAAPLDVFAYPYGEFTAELEALVRELGLAAVGQQSGPVGAGTDTLRIRPNSDGDGLRRSSDSRGEAPHARVPRGGGRAARPGAACAKRASRPHVARPERRFRPGFPDVLCHRAGTSRCRLARSPAAGGSGASRGAAPGRSLEVHVHGPGRGAPGRVLLVQSSVAEATGRRVVAWWLSAVTGTTFRPVPRPAALPGGCSP